MEDVGLHDPIMPGGWDGNGRRSEPGVPQAVCGSNPLIYVGMFRT